MRSIYTGTPEPAELYCSNVYAYNTQGGNNVDDSSQGWIQGMGALEAEALPPPPFTFRLYLINMLRIIIKFYLSIIT